MEVINNGYASKKRNEKNKKMNEDKKVYHQQISTSKWGVMKNFY